MKSANGTGVCVIPCSNPKTPIKKLKDVVVARVKGDGVSVVSSEKYVLVLTGNEAVLNDDDVVSEVLRDGDFITLLSKLSYFLAMLIRLYYICEEGKKSCLNEHQSILPIL